MWHAKLHACHKTFCRLDHLRCIAEFSWAFMVSNFNLGMPNTNKLSCVEDANFEHKFIAPHCFDLWVIFQPVSLFSTIPPPRLTKFSFLRRLVRFRNTSTTFFVCFCVWFRLLGRRPCVTRKKFLHVRWSAHVFFQARSRRYISLRRMRKEACSAWS